jgi:aryl-alcohol dehydrogenase-like predicted oxidoreductase
MTVLSASAGPSRIVLGTVQFGLPYGIANQHGQVSRAEATAMLEAAAAGGVDMLDTAIAYGDSETCLGEVGTQGFNLVTKLPAVPESCADVGGWVRQQVANSMTRLKVGAIYGLLLHQPAQLMGRHGKQLYHSLCTLKEDGLVGRVGISIYSPKELELLTPNFRFDLVQAPLNLVDRRLHLTGWLKKLKDQCIEIHVRSAFLQGLLLIPPANIPAKFSAWSGIWRMWRDWLESHPVSAVETCLAYLNSFPEIDRIVVGADTTAQLKEILSVSRTPPFAEFPNLNCDAEDLINPARWPHL